MLEHEGAVRVSFICTGNICRSPMAEIVFAAMLDDAGLADAVSVRSGGTSGWHAGDATDPRALRALAARGYDATGVLSQQVDDTWLAEDDLLVVMDRSHVKTLTGRAASDHEAAKVRLLTSFDTERAAKPDIDDPFYGNDAAFDRSLTSIEASCRALLQHVRSMLIERPAA